MGQVFKSKQRLAKEKNGRAICLEAQRLFQTKKMEENIKRRKRVPLGLEPRSQRLTGMRFTTGVAIHLLTLVK